MRLTGGEVLGEVQGEKKPIELTVSIAFAYLNQKIRIDQHSLSFRQLEAKTFHMICSPQRCIDLIQGILTEQGRDPTIAELSNSSRLEQSFVWEPVPDLCIPSELEKTKEALKWIDVMSPNLEEFATLLDDTFDLDNIFDREKLRKQCEMLLSVDQNQKCRTIVVRLGEQGCYIAQPAKEKYLPAYYIGGQAQEHVMDATGSGNAFLGGFCVGLLDHSGCIEDAVAYGTVAASFALEQVGVPELTCAEIGSDELWNGESVKVRMKKYQERIAYL